MRKIHHHCKSQRQVAANRSDGHRNWLFATLTLKPSAQNMQHMFEILNKTINSFNPQDGVTWSIAFEPLVAAMLKGSKHTNVLGLQSANDGYSKCPLKPPMDIC
jgi:hypothetical protein